MRRSNAAIVTTLRNAGAGLDSFIAYHLATGFARLFLFFDDPRDPDMARLAGHPNLTLVAHDTALRDRWKEMPEYPALRDFLDTEVMARQVLNAGVAMALARRDGIEWLLHIDSDELFILPQQSLAEHFASAAACDTLQYQNLEALPERDDIGDPFREVELFKLPPALAPEPDKEEARALLRATPQIPPKRFHFYTNGKSAVRVAAAAMRPRGVHLFANPDGPTRHGQSGAGFVLHYACCGFDAFWEKYATLGRFADRWMGRHDIRAEIGPLHLDARDVVAGGDRAAALDFYRRRIALSDPEVVAALMRHGLLARFRGPRLILERLDAAASARSR